MIYAESVKSQISNVRGSAHGLHFLNKGYGQYTDECLKLLGKQYLNLDTLIDDNWNPFELQ